MTGWIAAATIVVLLVVNHLRQLVRCNLCKGVFKPTAQLQDPWDPGWYHCPYCQQYGRPDGSKGADGKRLSM